MRHLRFIGILLSLLGFLFLSGCADITHKYYKTNISYERYNETKHEFSGYADNAILVVRYNSQFTFWVNYGRTYRSIGGMGWISKNTYKNSLNIFEYFIDWTNLPAELREKKRIELNNSQLFKDKDIEFRYFKDGSPAFVDKYDDNFIFERLYIPSVYAYYSKESILELLTTSRDALEKIK